MTRQPKYRAPQDPAEMAARIRAARAWARLTRPELAARLGRSKSTIERMEKGDPSALGAGNSARISRLWLELARATGVPSVFFLEQWDVMEERRQKQAKAERLKQVDQAAGAQLEARLARIEEALGLAPGPSLVADDQSVSESAADVDAEGRSAEEDLRRHEDPDEGRRGPRRGREAGS